MSETEATTEAPAAAPVKRRSTSVKAKTQGKAEGGYWSPGYTVDVLNAAASVRAVSLLVLMISVSDLFSMSSCMVYPLLYQNEPGCATEAHPGGEGSTTVE